VYTIESKCGSIYGREKNNFSHITMNKFFKFKAEVVTGKCPTCNEHTLLVGISREFFRCMSCGADLEQHVNGKISYIPTMHPNTLKSDLDKYFSDGES
jgi:ribosomal protein S27E